MSLQQQVKHPCSCENYTSNTTKMATFATIQKRIWLHLVTMSCQKPRGAIDRSEIGWWVSRETNEWLEPGNFASRRSPTAKQRCYQALLPWKKLAIWEAVHRRKHAGVLRLHTQLCSVPACISHGFSSTSPSLGQKPVDQQNQDDASAQVKPLCWHSSQPQRRQVSLAWVSWGCFGDALHWMNSASTKPPTGTEDWDVWQGRRAEQKGTCFLQALFRPKWHFCKWC